MLVRSAKTGVVRTKKDDLRGLIDSEATDIEVEYPIGDMGSMEQVQDEEGPAWPMFEE